MPLLELSHDWGEVTEESTEITSRLALNAPAPVDVEVDGLSVSYRAALNDETVLETGDRRLSMGSSGSEVTMNATLDHDDIPDWWAGHVARGERSELAVEPAVEVGSSIASASLTTPRISGVIESDVVEKIGGLADALATELAGLQRRFLGRAVLAPVHTDASWVVDPDRCTGVDAGASTDEVDAGSAGGDVDGDVAAEKGAGEETGQGAEEGASGDAPGDVTGTRSEDGGPAAAGTADLGGAATAVRIEVVLRNGLGVTFPFGRLTGFLLGLIGFRLVMNGVDLGEGPLQDVRPIPPGEQRTYTATIPLDDEALTAWWISHLEAGEETAVEIDVVVDVPLGVTRFRRVIHSYTDSLTTDVLDAVSLGP